MIKGNSTKELTNVDIVELFITESLLKGENVVIPDFGHLEIKSFGDKRAVLFESTGIHDFIQIIASAGEKEKKDINALCTIISLPLKGGKVVNLPKIGIFQPIKREKGEIHVSFISSSHLRKLINKESNKEEEIEQIELIEEQPKEQIREKIRYVYQTVEKIPDTQEGKNEVQKVQKIEIITDKIRAPETNDQLKEKEEQPIKTNDDLLIHQTNLPERQAVVDTGNQIVLQEVDVNKKEQSRNLKGVLLFIAIAIALLGGIVLTMNFRDDKKTAKMTIQNESINLPTLSERYYGHPAFWVYIYEANVDKLSSPINITNDIDLVIPDLKAEFDVDITDSLEIQRANILADIILKEKLRKK